MIINMNDIVGRLTICSEIKSINGCGKKYVCVCSCGKTLVIPRSSILSGRTKSCGCLRTDMLRKREITHGMSRTREYRVWRNIKSRCLNPRNNAFKNYGGRGITICPEWKNSFEIFLADMGKVPFDKAQIDRIDNEKGYSKNNCRWATIKDNCRNTRKTLLIEYQGEIKPIGTWAEEKGLSYQALYYRLYRNKFTTDECFTRPFRAKGGKVKYYDKSKKS